MLFRDRFFSLGKFTEISMAMSIQVVTEGIEVLEIPSKLKITMQWPFT